MLHPEFTNLSQTRRRGSRRVRTNPLWRSIMKVLGAPSPPPPNDRERALNTFLDAVKLDITTGKPNTVHDNLTTTERQAIRQLKQRQDVIIKPADKGSGTVVMDKTWYIDECNRQLTDTKFYRLLNEDITADIQKRVTFYVDRIHNDKLINDKIRQ